MDKTTIVNFRKEKCDVKITRTPKNEIPDPPKFGCFGNPFPVAVYGRERCIALFREYFLKRVETDRLFRQAVLDLRGKRLGCFCKPLACHGDIIKEWLDNMAKIHITSFVRRQTPSSGFSHWTLDDGTLLRLVEEGLPNAKRGYRDGVLLVPVPPEGFFSGITQLQDGDLLLGEFKARRAGEEPRKSSYAHLGRKMPAKSCYVVLYSHDVLKEGNENETDADYEIVSVNASPTEEEAPIPTGALIANHLGLSGGTATNMTDTEFVNLLRKSVEFWKDKALACPEELYDRIRIKERG